MDIPKCPKCTYEYTYELNGLYVCPDCNHEWNENNNTNESNVKDAFGNILNDGDDISIIKDLKVKGSSNTLKQGTKVKNIKIVEGDHNIDCKIEGFGKMSLKSEFVKKV